MPEITDDRGATGAGSYSLDPRGFDEVRRRILIVLGPLAPLVIAFVWYFDGHFHADGSFFDFIGLPIILVVTTYTSTRRARRDWESLRIEFSMGKLIRKRAGYPDLELAPGDVTRIAESARGTLIETMSQFKRVFISKHLVGYENFRANLSAWAPQVGTVPVARSLWSGIVSVASVLGCLCLFVFGPLYLISTQHREWVIPLGIALCLANLAMILVLMWRSPEMPHSFRYTAWILPALPLLAMFIRLV